MNDFTCGACHTPSTGRDICQACDTPSPTATPHGQTATAFADAAATRQAQIEETQRGNHTLATHLGHITDLHLDHALALQHPNPN
ncbi:hypothetical protein AB0I66_34675 [Streptomyces sp. NPDC050439]|uniref:hypothetical protein n=1 Tax=unclassified Streptomyces TaxID=2593676 RepID=UPI00341CFE88